MSDQVEKAWAYLEDQLGRDNFTTAVSHALATVWQERKVLKKENANLRIKLKVAEIRCIDDLQNIALDDFYRAEQLQAQCATQANKIRRLEVGLEEIINIKIDYAPINYIQDIARRTLMQSREQLSDCELAALPGEG